MFVLLTVVASPALAFAQKPTCLKIKDGVITDSAGMPLALGYDEFGYNYQARLFNGTYDSADRKMDGKYFGATGDVGPLTATPDPWQGKRVWGSYAIVEEVYNDPYGGYHGVDRTRLAHPAGLGYYK